MKTSIPTLTFMTSECRHLQLGKKYSLVLLLKTSWLKVYFETAKKFHLCILLTCGELMIINIFMCMNTESTQQLDLYLLKQIQNQGFCEISIDFVGYEIA